MKRKYLFILFSIPGGLMAQKTELPKLDYSYDALEPYIDSRTMEIHHTKHHQAYVTNFLKAIENTEAEKMSLDDIMINISKFSAPVRNNGGGHYNHSLFWKILSPTAKKSPKGELAVKIEKTFGGLEKLKEEINKAGATRFGSGWAWLIVTSDKELKVVSTANQDNPLMDTEPVRGIPILGIDVWEHAYYLKYQNKRPEYLEQIWNVIDWSKVEEYYEAAIKSELMMKLK
ncbi:MAG TPA: superoxide dismutase [Bacteroidales bacterium]|nr:superoxide dismutase [Bacteroidales bacterium]HOL99141.1 superoxide dismutase [Bacteroidales bacterium]HOM37410.1 superoxide dismutase [Bacteroidales bacterium]HPD24902.1 superoxide dismutase [Bacteroidales bacterium]HRT00628.1 superoxide dismutase [Bacteroidales bacterium]